MHSTSNQRKKGFWGFGAAITNGSDKRAKELAATMKSKKAAAIAQRLTQPANPVQTPAEYDGDAGTVALTDFKPSSTSVGWGRPAFNRAPDDGLLLESGGQFFETGIYAHAPAKHEYHLGTNWTTLTGKVGLVTGHPGTVQFEIKGDGKTLWKSQTVKSGTTIDFRVSLDGIQNLLLLTHPTDDGAGADWGFWLEPTLVRNQPL